MPDLDLSCLISRGGLGLPDLQINDHDRYMIGEQFLGATVSWKVNAVSSPFVDDEVTVFRTRGKVTEQLGIEVDGTGTALKANMDELTTALIQPRFTLTAVSPAGTWAYRCEAADYQGALTGPRLIFGRVLMVFSVRRSPVPLVGVV